MPLFTPAFLENDPVLYGWLLDLFLLCPKTDKQTNKSNWMPFLLKVHNADMDLNSLVSMYILDNINSWNALLQGQLQVIS